MRIPARWAMFYLFLGTVTSGCGNKIAFGSREPASVCAADCDLPSATEPDLEPSAQAIEEKIIVEGSNQLDVLFVVDSSGSMNRERQALGGKLSAFLSDLSGVDWRICVTTTDVTRERGRALPFLSHHVNSPMLTPDTPFFEDLFFDRLTTIPLGGGDEQGIHASLLAVQDLGSECFRDEAALATVILSDEDERSTGGHAQFTTHSQWRSLASVNQPQTLISEVADRWGAQKIFTAHSIVIRSGDGSCFSAQRTDSEVWYGTRYEELSGLTGGVIGNICAADYSSQLRSISAKIEQVLGAITLKCSPPEKPVVDVWPAPAQLKTSWNGDKLSFEPRLPAGTEVSLKYHCLD